jgi:hypothetical protein
MSVRLFESTTHGAEDYSELRREVGIVRASPTLCQHSPRKRLLGYGEREIDRGAREVRRDGEVLP